MSAPPPSLVRALAEELAWFRRRGAPRHHHLGVSYYSLCDAYPSLQQACSPRCARIARLLEEAAIYLHCEPSAFYASESPTQRRKGA